MKLETKQIDDLVKSLKFGKFEGLIPVVTQDDRTKKVLMQAFMDEKAFRKTLETGLMHYWSRGRRRLWMKGEESGHAQHVKEGYVDCDGDALLFKVKQIGNCCHTGEYSCFHNKIGFEEPQPQKADSSIIEEVFSVILDRQKSPRLGSYVASLLSKGEDQILKKVGEEATELTLASKKDSGEEIVSEAADLLFHTLVLLAYKGRNISEVFEELKSRRK